MVLVLFFQVPEQPTVSVTTGTSQKFVKYYIDKQKFFRSIQFFPMSEFMIVKVYSSKGIFTALSSYLKSHAEEIF